MKKNLSVYLVFSFLLTSVVFAQTNEKEMDTDIVSPLWWEIVKIDFGYVLDQEHRKIEGTNDQKCRKIEQQISNTLKETVNTGFKIGVDTTLGGSWGKAGYGLTANIHSNVKWERSKKTEEVKMNSALAEIHTKLEEIVNTTTETRLKEFHMDIWLEFSNKSSEPLSISDVDPYILVYHNGAPIAIAKRHLEKNEIGTKEIDPHQKEMMRFRLLIDDTTLSDIVRDPAKTSISLCKSKLKITSKNMKDNLVHSVCIYLFSEEKETFRPAGFVLYKNNLKIRDALLALKNEQDKKIFEIDGDSLYVNENGNRKKSDAQNLIFLVSADNIWLECEMDSDMPETGLGVMICNIHKAIHQGITPVTAYEYIRKHLEKLYARDKEEKSTQMDLAFCYILGLGGPEKHQEAIRMLSALPEGKEFNDRESGISMVPVFPGNFKMGTINWQKSVEKEHLVQIKDIFWIGKTEVTQGQYKAVMGKLPDDIPDIFRDEMKPVIRVSWDDAIEFCNKLNEQTKDQRPSGYRYALPSDELWEYACRGGYYFSEVGNLNFSGSDIMNDVAVQGQKEWEGPGPLKVCSKKSNKLGLYDMSGNVFEWCSNDYPGEGKKVVRGGAYNSMKGEYRCSCVCRDSRERTTRRDNVGFRVVLVPETEQAE